jgi:putative transposase
VSDKRLQAEVRRVHTENYGVYGVRKVHAQLGRDGVLGASGRRPVARCTTQRLMKALNLRGIARAKTPRTTVPGSGPDTRPDAKIRGSSCETVVRPENLREPRRARRALSC